MTLAVRGVNAANRTSTPLTIALPGGALSGDWLLALATGGNSSPLISGIGIGWIDLVAGTPMGTGNAWVGARQLTPADITAGQIQIASSANQTYVGGIIVFSGCAGFGTPGTVTKRATSVATTLAAAAGSNGQYVLVLQCEKSTSNPGISGVVPATSVVLASFMNGTALPSVWAGSYVVAGSPADRTITNPVASGNGLGLQVPVLASAAPPPTLTAKVWDGTAEQPVALAGIWDGSAIQPVTLDSYL